MSINKKTAAIVGAALAGIAGSNAQASELEAKDLLAPENGQEAEVKKTKPMPVLKINLNSGDHQFVANHASHRSHSSHRSHYSHRSGAMFS